MNKDSRIYVAGHTGLVGSAILRKLQAEGYANLLLRTHCEVDLTQSSAVDELFRAERPEYVFLAAARVGGILANATRPGDFIRENLLIQTHAIEAARRHGVAKLLFLGSSCIYPRLAPQPMTEDCLMTSALEPTNDAYAVAKIAGITMVQAYRRQYGFHGICLMPTNLYGPQDNFDPQTSHALPALLRRFHEAAVQRRAEVVVWGTGNVRREFLHADDLADAALFLMQHYDDERIINVGTGEDITIRDLAELIAAVVGYTGKIVYDTTKPDGTPRKWLDVSRLFGLGWRPRIGLREGIEQTYRWYRDHAAGQGGPSR